MLLNLLTYLTFIAIPPLLQNDSADTSSEQPVKAEIKKEFSAEPADTKSPVQSSTASKDCKVSSPTTADVVVADKAATVSAAPAVTSAAEVVVPPDEVKSAPQVQPKEEK